MNVVLLAIALSTGMFVTGTGDACMVDREFTLGERARDAQVVVVATVGELADTTEDDDGFLELPWPNGARVRFIVHTVLKGVEVPDTLTLSALGLYSALYQMESRDWDAGCGMYISRGEVVVLFLDGLGDTGFLRYGELFHLLQFEWAPSLMREDIVLVLLQRMLTSPGCRGANLPSVEERAKEAEIALVAKVGDLTGASSDEFGFFDGVGRLQFDVQVVLKGTGVPESLTLPFDGIYTTYYRRLVISRTEERGWSVGSRCAPDIGRGEVVLLFLSQIDGDSPMQYDSIFHLGRDRWDPILLQSDSALVRAQTALATTSGVECRGSWGALKQRFR